MAPQQQAETCHQRNGVISVAIIVAGVPAAYRKWQKARNNQAAVTGMTLIVVKIKYQLMWQINEAKRSEMAK